MEFSRKAKAFFKDKGISQREIATKIGEGEVYVSKQLNKKEPSPKFLNQLANNYPNFDLNEMLRTDEVLNIVAEEREEYKLRSIILINEIEERFKELKKIVSPK
ncbi:MAG: helix-turn-helix transcriptional regulator [Flavobacterium sp.]|nr:helix-turn-helix transcriptional regulator [Flavobacterium sp.]